MVFSVYVGELGHHLFNDLIEKSSPMEESKLNQIHLLGKDKPPLKLLF